MIITIMNRDRSLEYDLEVPANKASGELIDDIAVLLNPRLNGYQISRLHHNLFACRPERYIDEKETLSEAGVQNGDYIMIMPKKHI